MPRHATVYEQSTAPAGALVGALWIDTDAEVPGGSGGGVSATISVADYGAIGDGVTDDTAAINNAIVAASALGTATKRCRLHFPFGSYLTDVVLVKSNVWLDLGEATLLKRTTATAPLIRAVNTLIGATYYGTYSNIKITGGVVDPNGFRVGGGIVGLMYQDGLILDGVTVIHNLPAANPDWAMALGGRKGVVRNCRVIGGDAVFEDGIHLMHGQDWLIHGNYVESGDDAIAIGGEPSHPNLAADPDAIRRVIVSDNVVHSARAYGVSVYVMTGGASGVNWEVTDVHVHDLVGTAGRLRNGGVRIIDLNAPVPANALIRNIKIERVSLEVGSAAHDDTGVPTGVLINSCKDVTLRNVTLSLTEGASATTGFQGINVTLAEDVLIDRFRCDQLGRQEGIVIASSRSVKVRDSKLVAGSTDAPIYVSHSPDTVIEGNRILGLHSAQPGVSISSIFGRSATVTVRGNKFTQATTGGQGVSATNATVFAQLNVTDNDFTELSGIILNPATLTAANRSTVNNAGGYTAAATSIITADGTKFQTYDTIRVPRTGERMMVSAVATNTLTVTRGRQGTTAAALVDTDPLEVHNVIVRNNRGYGDHNAATTYALDNGHRGAYALPSIWQPSATAAASNVGRITRFVPDRDMQAVAIGFVVTIWTVGDTANPNVDVGIYDATGARLVSSGATAGMLNSTGVKRVTVASTQLRAGLVYYVGLSPGALGTSAVTLMGLTPASLFVAQMFGTGLGAVEYDAANSVHPLPSTWTIGAVSSVGWLLAVLEA